MENYRVMQLLINHYSNLVEYRKNYEKAVVKFYNEVADREVKGLGWSERDKIRKKVFEEAGINEEDVPTKAEITNLGIIIRKLMIKIEKELKSGWRIV